MNGNSMVRPPHMGSIDVSHLIKSTIQTPAEVEVETPRQAMKRLIVVMLLVLATSASASPRHPTPAQLKDAERFNRTFFMCHEYDPSYTPSGVPFDDENLMYKKACDLHDKLQKKFEKQGFCFYGRYHVGRPGRKTTQKEWTQETLSPEPPPKNRRNCVALPRS